ncbi:S8 family serine peptidase [Solihabitans fulvus]|uniref:S8 family serine peptidase n=1 Tax=Solihabitans fulvus TaxID=1892852 RepID=A0A5B2XW01_9PSEU|nr:S8 family serine peptidase [Solihabitans fulvus]KAA2267062.1 S8 family serine peptidase [Solihabitans fulvus]
MRTRRSLALLAAVAAASSVFGVQTAALADAGGHPAGYQPLSAAQADQLSQDVNTSVVVLLRDQPTPSAKGSAQAAARANAIGAKQSSLLGELDRVHAKKVRSFRAANAVAATVSKDEAKRLADNPDVLSVVPDSVIRGARPSVPPAGAAATSGTRQGSPAAEVCPAPGKVMLEPEALPVTHTASDDPNAPTAHSLGYTGTGVKVAYIAEGIDIDNPDFIRADGSHVFVDYQDFSSDGSAAPTSAGEAFLDASAIAAQGRQVYNVQNYSAIGLPTACDIRVLGTAPGAQLVGLKAFADNNFSTTSALLQSIDYAVNTAHVDVLNESFGFNPFPDKGSQDAVRLFNDAAVASGVTVTVSSGDAGITSTQGSPATDPAVVSVGGSTTFRWNAQTGYGGYSPFAGGGWLNDNISSLSSSGFDQAGRLIDLVAPGDGSFALCTPDVTRFTSCTDFRGQPSPVERSGGTSESAPLTAGVAALVIQAYRHAHHGDSPDPALVKRILTSTADDLGVPADEQGAGRLNAYKAVQAALSVQTAAPTGSTLLVDQTQLDGVGKPGSQQDWQVRVTNTGAAAQVVRLDGRGFGAAQNKQSSSVTLDDGTSQHFADWAGVNNNYQKVTFTVPPNTDRVSASIAYPGDPTASLNARVRLILIDPQGRYAAHSLPQGVGNFGNIDVHSPAAGTWTAVIFGRVAASGGTNGTVLFEATTNNTTGFGSVSPSSLTLAPGQTGTVHVSASTPTGPGDASGALVLNAGADNRTTVPISVRALVDTAHGGSFSGTLTGGNGRQTDIGQTNFYQFDVPAGQRDIAANVSLSKDPGNSVVLFLIDPQGQEVARGTNRLTTAYNPTTRAGTLQPVAQTDLYARNPRPGRWTLIVNFAGAIVGDALSQPFRGTIGFNKVDVHVTGLPSGGTLAAGKPVTATVTVHNTGTAPQNVFVDPRLAGAVPVQLAAVEPASLALPMPGGAASPSWLVPSQTSGVAVVAKATLPVTFDFGPESGDPDLPAAIHGTTAIGGVLGHPVAAGLWAADPAEIGPFGPGGAPAGSVDLSMTAWTEAFDQAATSPVGDLWRTSVTPSTSLALLTVQPGQTVTIPVTFTPTGPKGSVVRGTLYVDSLVVGNTPQLTALNFADPADTQPSGNELAGLPYEYRVG